MQKFYESRLVIKLSQSSQRVVILCRGEGLEPHIELDRSLVEFSPILPHSPADEKIITVRNPCKFPVEIYNLECDKVYLEEEKVSHLVHICKQLINAKQLCCKQRLWTNKLFLFNIDSFVTWRPHRDLQKHEFFTLCNGNYNMQGHKSKLYKNHSKLGLRKFFFSEVVYT